MKRIINILSTPAHSLSDKIHHIIPHNKKYSRIMIGVSIMLVGSALAVNGHKQDIIPRFVWDSMAYLLHGFGASPIIQVFTKSGE